MRTTWTFYSAGSIVFGSGASEKVGQHARQLGIDRALIVTDANLVAAGAQRPLLESLRSAGIAADVFEGSQPEPSLSLVDECLAMARRAKPSAVIGLGGGSNMDLAKITACVLAHGASARDYVGDSRIPGPVLPVIAVPTTAGTGSEVTAAAVLTDTQRAIKVGVLSNFLRPRLAIVDPRLTFSCPPKVTADSGIDALTHAIEAYTAVDNADFPLPPGEVTVYQGRHPLADCLAEKAIELVGKHLVRAVHHGDDKQAREGMALAALLAGLAFSNVGVAVVHAMEYPVGGATHCSHGAGNGLLLPFVMKFNLPTRRREFARIAALLGEDVAALDEERAAVRAVVAVERLKADVGIPKRLRDWGVTQEQLPEFAAKAFGIKRILRVNPRTVSEQDLLNIFREAW